MEDRTTKLRNENNRRILERMSDPKDDLRTMDFADTWFPPRPIIEKDKKAIERLYNKRDKDD
jgi:hypothetical protein